ncbi:Hypothetical predicted protein, partial [Pelobates cultripes]
MQTPTECSAPGPSGKGDASRSLVAAPPNQQGDVVASLEQLDSEEFHSLLDATMSKSVTQAIYTAMGVMSDNISHSISTAIKAANPKGVLGRVTDEGLVQKEGHKAVRKTHYMGKHTSKTELTDRVRPVTPEVMGPPRKRATRRAKA